MHRLNIICEMSIFFQRELDDGDENDFEIQGEQSIQEKGRDIKARSTLFQSDAPDVPDKKQANQFVLLDEI